MKVAELFKRDIFRSINGVVKADQLDESSVWQELDEFVVTKELDKHLKSFFSAYTEAYNSKNGDNIGVWVSGFFGSGKSHFIKVLSYLLENKEHAFKEETRKAIEFLKSKVHDSMLFADMQKAASTQNEVILFNIDSKADSNSGRDAILSVFLKVFNEHLGYCSDHPHIAHLERYLDEKNKLESFISKYEQKSGHSWKEERDAYHFNRDEVIEALSETLGQSKDSCEKWIDSADTDFSLTIENFAKWVNEYLDKKPKETRVIFLVDEVGQFIGQDTHLMLNLQTITEELGVKCKGRAWVVVTSQEDIDAVLGDINASKSNDFSKIQGRFSSRLSLSSANVDEVIQKRLLEKTPGAQDALKTIYSKCGDILQNQISFKDIGTTYKKVQDEVDFASIYPFLPYQFRLLQRIFESIRKAGATGLHLAQGERSLLDSFQSAAKSIGQEAAGVLVPLYRFYPSIESFLDTTVKRTIDHAKENPSLESFDVEVLQILFLIRYVDEMKGNIDNLVTLCIDEIDTDKIALKRKVSDSLSRLEKESLISRNGDEYQFLTNEERDVNREIKAEELNSGAEAKAIGEFIFEDVFGSKPKFIYKATKSDFKINRICDSHPVGNKVESGLTIEVITALNDRLDEYTEMKCKSLSGEDGGRVVLKLAENYELGNDIRTYLKTDKYLKTKNDGTLSHTAKRIHKDLAEENRIRRERICKLLTQLILDCTIFVAEQRIDLKPSDPRQLIDDSLTYLVKNTFNKLGYLSNLQENPTREMQAVLRSSETLVIDELPNLEASREVSSYIDMCNRTSKKVVLSELLDRYSIRPFGWPREETLLTLSRLYASGVIQFVKGGSKIPKERVFESISPSRQWNAITIVPKISVDSESIRKAKDLGRELFTKVGPDNEEGLALFLREHFADWSDSLSAFKALADTGNYPGGKEIEEGMRIVRDFSSSLEPNELVGRFLSKRDELLDFNENFVNVRNFYKTQKPMWEKLRQAFEEFKYNALQLNQIEEAKAALERINNILNAPAPYSLIKDAQGLITSVSAKNKELLETKRAEVQSAIKKNIHVVKAEIQSHSMPDSQANALLAKFDNITTSIEQEKSLAHLDQLLNFSETTKESLLKEIEKWVSSQSTPSPGEPEKKVKPRVVVKLAAISSKSILENETDIDDFLNALKASLLKEVQDHRIEIR